jgi:ankyrin repeat protein
MHQTVREFFLDPDGPVANSEFWIPETRAHVCIAIICIRYLTICATSTSLLGRLPKIDSWTLAEYKDYIQYLNKRPLAFYALCHVKSHIGSCGQDTNVKYAVSQFIDNLTTNPGASLLEGWASSHLCQNHLSNTQGIIAKNFKDEVLRTAARYGFTTAAEVVLSAGTDLEKKDEYGRTPLLWAAINGHKAIVKSLLDRGAIVEAEDVVGQTSLLEKGAVIDVKDDLGRTSLFLASWNGHTATVKLLLEKGAVINVKDDLGRTSLFLAAENGHTATVELLLKKGAVINATDRNGRASLLLAAENGHTATEKLLLEKGAVIDASYHECQTLPPRAINAKYLHNQLMLEERAVTEGEECYD